MKGFEQASPAIDRSTYLVRGLDHETMVGVEFGPWYAPITPRANGWKTVVVDFTDTEALREIARTNHAESIRESVSNIEEVDVVWRTNEIGDALLAIHPEGYDYLVASHVFEHVPDLIGFLGQLERVMKPGAVISLAMPDMRYCFDFLKPLTLTDEFLAAHRDKRMRHSPETLFRANAYQTWVGGSGAWTRDVIPELSLIGSLDHAFRIYQEEVEGDITRKPYIDAHASIFVPASFTLVMLELNALGMINFRIKDLIEGVGSEFFVQLEVGDLQISGAEVEEQRLSLLLQIVEEQAVRLRALSWKIRGVDTKAEAA